MIRHLENLSLTRVFNMITQGEIQVPAFQRSFVWNQPAIIKLLESVYLGRPIGMIVLWRSTQDVVKTASKSDTGFPTVAQPTLASYVIDGAHRLICLYNSFHRTQVKNNKRFKVAFDLNANEFVSVKANLKPHQILLSSVFSTDAINKLARAEQDRSVMERRVSELVRLQAQFQNYALAVMTLENSNLDDVISTFELINVQGTKLRQKDIDRADKMRSIEGFRVVFKKLEDLPSTYKVHLWPRELQQTFEDGRPRSISPHPIAELRVTGSRYNVRWMKLPERFVGMRLQLEAGIKHEFEISGLENRD